MKIQGITIKLINKIKIGTNSFGEDIFEEKETMVDNVLVAPVSQDDYTDHFNLYGKYAKYQLAIPKGDTNNWEDSIVELFGGKYKTFGHVIQGIESNIPLSWNKKVMVENYE